MAMIKKDEGKTIAQAFYVYQNTKGFSFIELQTFWWKN